MLFYFWFRALKKVLPDIKQHECEKEAADRLLITLQMRSINLSQVKNPVLNLKTNFRMNEESPPDDS